MKKIDIMFIDDDEEFLYFMKRVSGKVESIREVYSATHGQDALDKLNRLIIKGVSLPDVALVDINMPVMNGFEFLENFKELKKEKPELDKIVLIAMLTSSDEKTDRDKADSYDVVDRYLVKPKGLEEIKAMLEGLSS